MRYDERKRESQRVRERDNQSNMTARPSHRFNVPCRKVFDLQAIEVRTHE